MQMPFEVAFSFSLNCKISLFLFSMTFLLLIFLLRESSSSRFEKWMMKPFQTIPCCRARVFFPSKKNLVVVYSRGMQSVGLMPFCFSPKNTADRLLFVSMQKCVFRQGQAENRIENDSKAWRGQWTKNWDRITAILQYTGSELGQYKGRKETARICLEGITDCSFQRIQYIFNISVWKLHKQVFQKSLDHTFFIFHGVTTSG